MIDQLLTQRALPALTAMNDGSTADTAEKWRERRKELIHLLSEQVYGFTPAAPEKVDCEILSSDEKAFANKAVHQKLSLSFDTPNGKFSFPVDFITPKKVSPAPLFITIAFRPDVSRPAAASASVPIS